MHYNRPVRCTTRRTKYNNCPSNSNALHPPGDHRQNALAATIKASVLHPSVAWLAELTALTLPVCFAAPKLKVDEADPEAVAEPAGALKPDAKSNEGGVSVVMMGAAAGAAFLLWASSQVNIGAYQGASACGERVSQK